MCEHCKTFWLRNDRFYPTERGCESLFKPNVQNNHNGGAQVVNAHSTECDRVDKSVENHYLKGSIQVISLKIDQFQSLRAIICLINGFCHLLKLPVLVNVNPAVQFDGDTARWNSLPLEFCSGLLL